MGSGNDINDLKRKTMKRLTQIPGYTGHSADIPVEILADDWSAFCGDVCSSLVHVIPVYTNWYQQWQISPASTKPLFSFSFYFTPNWNRYPRSPLSLFSPLGGRSLASTLLENALAVSFLRRVIYFCPFYFLSFKLFLNSAVFYLCLIAGRTSC